ncbi:hypothetical protein BDV27DRAFT_167845 [Aspergillus caelatus]|uniref:P-loop containing nucleoside triphosphate hydrolase protein n=1 Tax=Aspergillus caelatus TaxID=61420 RepID=A0A5N6ZU09_9EURO|nr:uncharacterized protein BDV27DRAFT_167845 [Aspergillus caelatus]KAE8360426.1 hypothetical protein BDV27DRAFT_167845 [Aspergillus caelatus]
MTRSTPQSRFCLLTYPRTGSNLLVKILNLDNQPTLVPCKDGGYFFARLSLLRYDMGCAGAHIKDLRDDQRAQETACIQECLQALTQYVHDAENQDKGIFFKEHTHMLSNPVAKSQFVFGADSIDEAVLVSQRAEGQSPYNETLLPDRFLNTLRPTFLIRHPALAFPSYYRAARKADGDEYLRSEQGRRVCRNIMTLRWSRQLYNFYVQHFNGTETSTRNEITWPLILDADDIMTNPAVVIRFCENLGLDTTRLRFQWDKDEQKRRPGIMAFRSTIDGSTGIDVSKASGENIDLDESAKQWREEFGGDSGQVIEMYVREAMADYEFLKERRLRA